MVSDRFETIMLEIEIGVSSSPSRTDLTIPRTMLEAIVPHPINPTDSWFLEGKVGDVVASSLSPDDIRVVEDGRCDDDRREGKSVVATLEKDSANEPKQQEQSEF